MSSRSDIGAHAPLWRITRWLVEPDKDVPAVVRTALIGSLYGTLPIFFGGVLNTIAVSSLLAGRLQTLPFLIWAAAEIVLAIVRLPVLIAGRRASSNGHSALTDLYIFLALCWAAGVGYGSFLSITSGDWVAATLACLSSAAMVGGICLRNFAAPRLVVAMILLSMSPTVVAAVLSGESILLVVAFQIPVYVVSMAVAAHHLNKMLIKTMCAELDSAARACHDDLTGLLNRTGFSEKVRQKILSKEQVALFYLDLDGFKGVNDSFGHAGGDALLSEVAARLKAVAGPDDVVGRIGGDEFIVAARVDSPQEARLYGNAIISSVAEAPYLIGDEAAVIGVSVGIALSPMHDSDLQALLRIADAALYDAKSRGRCRCVISGDGRFPALVEQSSDSVVGFPSAKAASF